MSITKMNPITLFMLAVPFLMGLSLVIAGFYGFYWIGNELYLIFSTGKAPASLEQFLAYINQQPYQLSGTTEAGKTFNFSVSIGIAQWVYAFLAFLLLRTIPEILKILISTGLEIILSASKSFHSLDNEKSEDEPDNDFYRKK